MWDSWQEQWQEMHLDWALSAPTRTWRKKVPFQKIIMGTIKRNLWKFLFFKTFPLMHCEPLECSSHRGGQRAQADQHETSALARLYNRVQAPRRPRPDPELEAIIS